MQPTLFQQALGAAFFRLPESLRRLHASRGRARYAGRARVERGSGPAARLCAWMTRLPPAGEDVALVVDFDCNPRLETWSRDFGGRAMRSAVTLRDGLLRERLGPLQFRFALHANDGAIWWTVAGVRLLGVVPLPASLFDGVRCREYERDGRYHFEVDASLPVAGRIIRYGGWLEPA